MGTPQSLYSTASANTAPRWTGGDTGRSPRPTVKNSVTANELATPWRRRIGVQRPKKKKKKTNRGRGKHLPVCGRPLPFQLFQGFAHRKISLIENKKLILIHNILYLIKLTSLYINYTGRASGRKVRGQSYWGVGGLWHPSVTSSGEGEQGGGVFDHGQCKIKIKNKIK